MRALVFVEHHDGEPVRAALGLLSKAAAVFDDVAAVLCGSDVEAMVETVGLHGAGTVYVAEDQTLADPLPQPRVDVVSRLVREQGFDAVLFAASVLTADVAAGVSARLEAGLNWDLVDLSLDGERLVGVRAALQDSVLVDVGWSAAPRLALVRAGTFEPVAAGGRPTVQRLQVQLEDFSRRAAMLEQAHAESEGPSIEEAEIIVAGGRGLGGPESFALVEELARALGGAVGATRAVVDAGWYPYAAQVGQTGKTVAPRLYIACGISGAIQHKIGMQSAGAIVAINKDRNAPIFDFCDLGVVGDLHEIVPKLTELVKQKRGS